ncbi:flagellar motor switch phosphatase FliY [Anaerosinus massiliensis]|uniref:flagellar motor switch phosphatase FliY n=1 Tax=Massilibacillus massiliensis TaxID=1806837 RepID=UPI000A73F530|nr:flagellar motor switch phosphatase FliY [Massilibacillus massiliensis]
MNDGFLSQDEINALLEGNTEGGSQETATTENSSNADDVINEMERDALGEIGNISMGSAATTLSVLLGRRVDITTPRVSVDTLGSIKDHYPLPYLLVEVGYTIGIDGNNILAIREQDSLIIADLMMGGDGTNPPTELNELYMSAVGEAMNQMMGSVSTSLSTMFNKKIDISPPNVKLVDLASAEPVSELVANDEPIVRVAFRMEVEGLIDSEIMQILPIKIAKDMVESLMTPPASETSEVATTSPASVSVQEPVAAVAQAPQQVAATAAPMQQQTMYAAGPAPQAARVAPGVPVQPVQFAPLTANGTPISDANLGLIMDVPLQVTVELGRTKKLIKDILDLAAGSIIELDKLAGEPVDILVNGKLLAKGEVVVIDENFGVRITDIISPMERARNIQ